MFFICLLLGWVGFSIGLAWLGLVAVAVAVVIADAIGALLLVVLVLMRVSVSISFHKFQGIYLQFSTGSACLKLLVRSALASL